MTRQSGFILVTAAMFVGGCAPTATGPRVATLPTVTVAASAETVPVATAATVDAADDPAIFARPDGSPVMFAGTSTPAVILGTDKKAGLYVFGLDGQSLQFLPDGLLNNVDLRADGNGFVAGASDRGRMGVALYRYDGSGQLRAAGFIKSDVIEPYGFCMGRYKDQMIAILIAKDGQVRQYAISGSGDALTGTEMRRFAIGTQSEGCAVDDETGTLYIGEEMVGVWQYSLDPADPARTSVARAGDGSLVVDVEGVTIIRDGADKFLIVSSQGDSAFAVWQLGGATPAYVGRFRVAANGGVDGVSGTDGLDALGGAVGSYGRGLVVVQDDVNTGGPQNFKMVDWTAIRAALGK